MKKYRFMEVLGREVSKAARGICEDYEKGIEPDEDTVNATLKERLKREIPNRIADGLDGVEKGDVSIFARVLSRTKEEPEVGADLGIAYESDLPGHGVSKGILVQSKTCDPGPRSANCNTEKLPGQVQDMLNISSDSFVFAFPIDGTIKVFPALEIGALDPLKPSFPNRLYGREIGRFFQLFAECFVGDHKVVPSIERPRGFEDKLEMIRADFLERRDLRQVLFIGVRPRGKTLRNYR